MRRAKRLFWLAFDGLLFLLWGTLGRLWRRFVRPRSVTFVEVARLLRALRWFHRFDAMGTHCAFGRRVRIWGAVRIFLGERCALFDDVVVAGVGVLRVGDRSTIGAGTTVVCRERVEIGSDVMIASDCFITDCDHEFEARDVPISGQGLRVDPVVIGDDVWVGTQTVILRGVRIGDGAVIGANSFVIRDVPPYTVVAGNPARVVKTRRAGARVDCPGLMP
jgi:acetyltransferase-like isoleucine patch superfamily enzyme